MKKFVFAAKCLIILSALTIIICCSFYRYQISPVDKNGEQKEIEVKAGSNWYSIANTLEENNLIRSSKFYKLYIKLFKPGNLEEGTYYLSPSMSLDKIIEKLEGGSSYNSVTILFKEGLNMRSIATIIAKETENTTEDVYNLLKDNDYIDELINNYWFLTDEIKNDKIYYPLEGYLFPETYVVNEKISVKDLFKVMLDETSKRLEGYKDAINNSGYTVHQMLTLSSIIEAEVGRSNDRALISGVFYNRLNTKGETLGSDVTAYYGAKMDDWTNGLGDAEYACNGYNTRMLSSCPINGLPVGPICNPSINSLTAALNPTPTDKFFFLADCDGNTYLNYTYPEHLAKKAQLERENNWCDN